MGVPSCLDPSRPTAPPCAAPTRPARGMPAFWIPQMDSTGMRLTQNFVVPRHALHGTHSQKPHGRLVGSQERRAAIVPRIKRWSTAGVALQQSTSDFDCSFFRINVPDRRAIRRFLPTCPWYVRGLDSTGAGFGKNIWIVFSYPLESKNNQSSSRFRDPPPASRYDLPQPDLLHRHAQH